MNDYLWHLYAIERVSELRRQAEKERLIREFSHPTKTNVFSWVLETIPVRFGTALFTFFSKSG